MSVGRVYEVSCNRLNLRERWCENCDRGQCEAGRWDESYKNE
ncbi:hypothetical protein I4O98_019755 [Clostridioides difficile]